MIRTVFTISLLRLWHNRAELVLTFLVPVMFFSIFAWIFGSRGTGSTPKLKVAICDEVQSTSTQKTATLLADMQSLQLYPASPLAGDGRPYSTVDRRSVESLVQRGTVTAAIVFKPSDDPTQPTIEILADSFDQVAGQVLLALVQKSSIAATFASQSADSPIPYPTSGGESSSGAVLPASAFQTAAMAGGSKPLFQPPPIALIDVLGARKSNPIIAMYAAGIAVMFLLFSATTASGSLLEERENSTLERLFNSGLSIDQLLMGKWVYLMSIGCLQMTVMFTFAAAVFGLELRKHLEGFIAMTIVTSGAVASFALMLATLSRTRVQLGWLSTIVILTMSALGGSMVPRYLMSESIQRVGQWTFNAWALDGYNKVFWRELPLIEIRHELTVLVVCALVFMIIARLAANRWDQR